MAIPLGAALVIACQGDVPPPKPQTTVPPTPLCHLSDPAQVVAPQRIVLLTSRQLMNMIRLVSYGAAQVVLDGALFQPLTDFRLRFPPSREENLKSIPDSTALASLSLPLERVGEYVRDNFATVTKCALPATDSCAVDYLRGLAQKAYRRRLTEAERARLAALYETLKSQVVNDQQVALTVEETTGFAVSALLLSPQLLWRWEVGAETSSSPPGVYLTDAELASNLSFFLTDRPPDEALAADADSGTLRANLRAHVDRILATPAARDWLTLVMRTYFYLNTLQGTVIDPTVVPIAGSALYADLEEESRLFLGDVMWNGKVTDLLTSRKAFLNSNLASIIYGVPVPPGATPSRFVETTLPASERAGMLTNAGFITLRARADGVALVPRGLAVKALFTCIDTPGMDDTSPMAWDLLNQNKSNIPTQTAKEQAAFRAAAPICSSCHASFDPYGLVLDWYDAVGRYRTVDDLGKPVDGHTRLPAEVGGAEVQNAVELAEILSKSDVFTNCIASSALQYALVDTAIELPLPSQNRAGCAAAGIAHDLRRSTGQSFPDLFRAIATSPAFLLRKVDAVSGTAQYNVPPTPAPRPARAYNDRSGRAAAPPAADAMLTRLASRRSMLDFVAAELDLLRKISPVGVRAKLDDHFNAVLEFTNALTNAINTLRQATE